ncbi:MAG TPA: hypothetical protein VGP72_29745 [Planctomycetota bacterium]|jgi:hypothetical protein
MKKHHLRRGLSCVGLGLLAGCLGFSLALATSTVDVVKGGAEVRAITTNVTRTPVSFATGPDLGVVVVGTQFTRQILAQFGFKPHLFSFGSVMPTSALTLLTDGLLSGTKTDTDPETFEIRVIDEADLGLVPPTKRLFTLSGVKSQQDPQLALQFVNGPSLPVAVAHEPYSFTFHANGGSPAYTFEFASDADFGAAAKFALALDPVTGELFGRPVMPTAVGEPVTFTLLCRDSIGTTTRRTFSLVVLAGTISSDLVATSGTFKLNFGTQTATDAFKLTLLLNKTDLARAGIRQTADLEKLPIQINFGGVAVPPHLTQFNALGQPTSAAFPNTFDKSGSVRFPNILQNLLPIAGEKLSFEIKLDPKTGILTVTGQNFDMIKTLGANFSTFKNPIIPMNVRIGAAAATSSTTGTTTTTSTGPIDPATVQFDKTDVIRFMYQRNVNVGKGSAAANDKFPPGGLFIITKVLGTEKKISQTVDNIVLKCSGLMRAPKGAPVTFQSSDFVDIFLGKVPLGRFPATSLKNDGSKLTFRNDDSKAAPLHNFIIDNKRGTIYFDTFGLLPRGIFGEDILVGGEPLVTTITVSIATPGAVNFSFDGQSAVALFRRGKTIKNK